MRPRRATRIKKMRKLLLLVIVLSLIGLANAEILNILWEFDASDRVYNVYAVNLDEDYSPEVVADTRIYMSYGEGGRVHGLSDEGDELWYRDVFGGLYDSYAEQFANDTTILIGTPGRCVSVDKKGETRWNYLKSYYAVRKVYASDLDGDGYGEALFSLVGDWKGNSVVVAQEDGKKIVDYGFKRSEYPSSIHAVDLDGDGVKEILVGTAYYSVNPTSGRGFVGYSKPTNMYAYRLDGTLLWTFNTPGGVKSIASADIDGDKSPEVLVGTNMYLEVLDGNGTVEWNYPTAELVNEIIVDDINNDGKPEVILGSERAYVLSGRGEVLWKTDKLGSVAAVATLDLGEGVKNVLAGSGKVYLFDEKGGELWRSASYTEVTDIKVSDINKDGYSEIIVGSTDERVRVFETRTYGGKLEAVKLYEKAREYYAQGDYDNSTKYAREARLLFELSSDASNMNKCQKLIDDAADRVKADGYYEKALMLYGDRDYVNSSYYAAQATLLYKRVGDTAKAHDSAKLEEGNKIRPMADGNYTIAVEFYGMRDYENASNYAVSAYNAYAWINDEGGMNLSDALLTKSEQHLQAYRYYKEAEYHYVDGRYENASYSITQSRNLYGELGDEEWVSTADNLAGKIDAAMFYKNVLVYGGILVVLGVILTPFVVLAVLVHRSKKGGNRSNWNIKSIGSISKRKKGGLDGIKKH